MLKSLDEIENIGCPSAEIRANQLEYFMDSSILSLILISAIQFHYYSINNRSTAQD